MIIMSLVAGPYKGLRFGILGFVVENVVIMSLVAEPYEALGSGVPGSYLRIWSLQRFRV